MHHYIAAVGLCACYDSSNLNFFSVFEDSLRKPNKSVVPIYKNSYPENGKFGRTRRG